MAVIASRRPDDADGAGFCRQLKALRRRVAKRKRQAPLRLEHPEWWVDDVGPGAPEERSASAYPRGYMLSTFALKDSFLDTQPADMLDRL